MKRDRDYMCDCVKQGMGQGSQCKSVIHHHRQPKASVLLVYHSVDISTVRGGILVVVQPTQLKEVMVLLVSRGQRATLCCGHPPQQGIIQPKISIAPR